MLNEGLPDKEHECFGMIVYSHVQCEVCIYNIAAVEHDLMEAVTHKTPYTLRH